MKSSNIKTIIAILSLALIAVLAAYVGIFGAFSKNADEKKQKFAMVRTQNRENKQTQLASTFKVPSNGQNDTVEDSSEKKNVNVDERDAFFRRQFENREKLAALQSETDDVYGQMAEQAYEELLSEEKTDPQWERRISDELKHFLREAPVEGTMYRTVDCGSRICKLEVFHTSADAAQIFWNLVLSQNLSWETETYSKLTKYGNGSSGTKLFFSRTASDLTFHIRARDKMLNAIQ